MGDELGTNHLQMRFGLGCGIHSLRHRSQHHLGSRKLTQDYRVSL